ncbi:MAG: deoxyribonuclease V [Actinobacteria bacterium]|nr:deoxyribonuclease V [Actinomycetota bacterium]
MKEHHRWDLKYEEAVALQTELSKKLILNDSFGAIEKIAGVDVKCVKERNEVLGVVIIFSYPELNIIEIKMAKDVISYPYIPGLLTFREGPVVEQIFTQIKNIPDLVFFDGQGYCHPRRFGLASHMGLILNLPTIGCAKNKLCGNYKEPSQTKGSYSYIFDDGEIIGAALRTKNEAKPIFVSIGHKVSLISAIKFTLSVSKFRIPEPTRIAHNYLEGIV